MKLLIVSALCVMMTLISAAALSDEEASDGAEGLIQPEEHHVVKRATSCPMGWTAEKNRCFFYVSQPMTWAAAQRFCESMNAHLASVHSLGEYQQIQRVIFDATYTSKLAWIGGSDAQQNGYWFWIDGTHFSYAKWCYGEPNNLWFVEHCIVINYSGSTCWNDQSCHDRLPSVCAKKIR